jgi:hypothetical protein
MPDNDVTDLLKFAHEDRPVDFKAAFHDVMQNKISAAIDARKENIAQNMMDGQSEEEDVEVDLVDEPDIDSDEE